MKELVVRPDAKGRICLGKLAHGVSSYKAIFDEKSHKIILEPYSEIPYHERWLYENEKALNSVIKGIQESLEGKTKYKGSFSQYIEEDDI